MTDQPNARTSGSSAHRLRSLIVGFVVVLSSATVSYFILVLVGR